MPTVLFDLFDTLVHLKQPDRPAQQAFADKLGLELEAVRAWWKTNMRRRMVGFYPTYAATVESICTDLGSTVAESVRHEICRERDRDRTESLHAVEAHVLEMLAQLRQSGWQIGVVSNATPDEVAPWSTGPLSACVDDAVFSCDVGCMKPEPEIFELACKRFGIALGAARFVGDGGFDELQGAAALGIPVIKANWFRLKQDVVWSSESPLIEVDDVRLVPQTLESTLESL